jgi:crotonobetainyl-CoA:carnitine CoA-transferase CaiB-like acyl-CoA transferase
VIKVEEPGRGDYIRSLPPHENGVSVAFELLNRGKKSVAINLETEKGREILMKLASTADVFLESFQPGTTKKLGCDFEAVRKVNSRIVYCSLTGFGQTGPYKDIPGHDINVLALAGILSLNGKAEPIVPALQIGDLAGGMLAALTITTALFNRQRGDGSHYVDVSMLDVMLSWLAVPLALHLGGNERLLAGELPFYHLYKTRDSGVMAVGAIESQFWEELCHLINRPDLLPDQYSREPRRTEVIDAIQSAFITKTREEWFEVMRERQLPCAPVLTLDEVTKDEQAQSRQMILSVEKLQKTTIRYIGNPCKISGTATMDLLPSPKLGQHSIELLKEIGYSAPEIQALVEGGIIQIPLKLED